MVRLSKVRGIAEDSMEIQGLRHVPIHGVGALVSHVDAMLALLRRRHYDLLSSGTVDDDIGSNGTLKRGAAAVAASPHGEEKGTSSSRNDSRVGSGTPGLPLSPLHSIGAVVQTWPFDESKNDSESGVIDVSAVDLSRLAQADGLVSQPPELAGTFTAAAGAAASSATAASAPSVKLPPISSTPSRPSAKAKTWAGSAGASAGATTPLSSSLPRALGGGMAGEGDLAGAAAAADARFTSPTPPPGKGPGSGLGVTTPSLRSALHIVTPGTSGTGVSGGGGAPRSLAAGTPKSVGSAFTRPGTTGLLSPKQRVAAAVDRSLLRSVGMDAATAVEIDAVVAAHTHFRQHSSLAMRAFAHARSELQEEFDSDSEDGRLGRTRTSYSVGDGRQGGLSRASSNGQLRAALASLDRRSASPGREDVLPAGADASFERDERSFHNAMDEIVRSFGRLVIRQVVDTRSSARAVLLLHTVCGLPVARRPRLADVVTALQSHVLQQFDNDLDGIVAGVEATQQRGAAPSEFFRNWPPLASKVAFCRSCKSRIRIGTTLVASIGRGVMGAVVHQRALAIARQLDTLESRSVIVVAVAVAVAVVVVDFCLVMWKRF